MKKHFRNLSILFIVISIAIPFLLYLRAPTNLVDTGLINIFGVFITIFLPTILVLGSIILGVLDYRLNSRKNWQLFFSCILIILCIYIFVDGFNEIFPKRYRNKTVKITDTESAFAFLLETDCFSDILVGIEGNVSIEFRAFQKIIQSENSVNHFTMLQQQAKLPGQLYALCGIFLSDSSRFNDVISMYNNIDDSITTQSGCVLYTTPVDSIIKYIRNGTIPKQFSQFAYGRNIE
jgi:hypothetical protein